MSDGHKLVDAGFPCSRRLTAPTGPFCSRLIDPRPRFARARSLFRGPVNNPAWSGRGDQGYSDGHGPDLAFLRPLVRPERRRRRPGGGSPGFRTGLAPVTQASIPSQATGCVRATTRHKLVRWRPESSAGTAIWSGSSSPACGQRQRYDLAYGAGHPAGHAAWRHAELAAKELQRRALGSRHPAGHRGTREPSSRCSKTSRTRSNPASLAPSMMSGGPSPPHRGSLMVPLRAIAPRPVPAGDGASQGVFRGVFAEYSLSTAPDSPNTPSDQLGCPAEVSGVPGGLPAFKAGGTGDPRPAGSIPVHLRH